VIIRYKKIATVKEYNILINHSIPVNGVSEKKNALNTKIKVIKGINVRSITKSFRKEAYPHLSHFI
jgi:hypothetical protein